MVEREYMRCRRAHPWDSRRAGPRSGRRVRSLGVITRQKAVLAPLPACLLRRSPGGREHLSGSSQVLPDDHEEVNLDPRQPGTSLREIFG